jgi:sugar-specific transcriptional regulator TrmB
MSQMSQPESPFERSQAQLQRLGLSSYESKAYLAMLTADGPLTGYEVAKVSGVPRSTVYEVLGKLTARGLVFESEGAGPARYAALPIAAFTARVRREYEESLEVLNATVPAMNRPPASSLTHHLSGFDAVVDRARDLARGARREVFISAWPQDVAPLLPDLREAEARSVEVSLVTYGEVPPVGTAYVHHVTSPDLVLERVGCRLFVLAADRQSVVIAGATASENWGLYSEDVAVVLLATEFIRHDIGLNIVVRHLGNETFAKFWQEDPVVRRLVTGR